MEDSRIGNRPGIASFFFIENLVDFFPSLCYIKTMNENKISETDSIQELAHFWDTHDLTDFEDQLEEVNETAFERKKFLKIQLEPEDTEAVLKIARSRGVSYTELIKEWVLEKIHVK